MGQNRYSHHLRNGDTVRVKSLSQILETLDDQGALDGLPFMPEMVALCGRTAKVTRRVDHVFIDQLNYVARLTNTVILDQHRCSGANHRGCQMGCHLLWKEEWLTTADDDMGYDTPSLSDVAMKWPFFTEANGHLYCQATSLPQIKTRIPFWDVRQYWRGLTAGNFGLVALAVSLFLLIGNKVRWWFGKDSIGMLSGPRKRTELECLNLELGEWVEVKSREEIQETLDVHGKHRGMAFVPEMAMYCGRRFRVARRVERMVQEDTGQLRQLRDTVALESVTCMGLAQRQCPRGCFHLWREGWLKRVSDPGLANVSASSSSDRRVRTSRPPGLNKARLYRHE